MKKDQVDIANATDPDSKTENGVAEVPLTPIAVDAFRNQLSLAGPSALSQPQNGRPTLQIHQGDLARSTPQSGSFVF